MRRSNFGDLLEPGLREVFFMNYNAIPQKYDRIFKILSSTKQDETDSGISGFGQFDEVAETGVLTYEDALQGYDVSYVHKSFKKGFKVSEELVDDDQYGKIKKMSANLGVSAKRTVETKAAQVLNGAFVTTYITGGDGKALCATDHLRADGGTAQDNSETHNFNETYLDAGMLAMRTTLDDKGQLIMVSPNLLVVPPKLEKSARILIESTGRPTASTTMYYNDINVYNGALEILTWDYLGLAAGGSDTAWFLIDTAIAELNFFWRKQLNFGQDESFDTDEALFKAKMRFSCGFSNWRGVWGSTGAAS